MAGHAVALALLTTLVPQDTRVDAPGWATPWSRSTGNSGNTAGFAWNSYGTTIVNDGGADFVWRFSDTNTTLTASVGGYNGNYYNSPAQNQTSAQGGTDKAVSFNGSNQYASVSTNTQFSMNNTQAYSLEVVFKLTTLAASGNPRLISKMDLGTGTGGWEIAYNGASDPNASQFYCARHPASGNGSSVFVGSNGTTFAAGQWMHVVCTFDGATLRFYQNGVLTSSAAAGGNINNNTKDLYFGSLGGTSSFANGVIDEAALYWNALSAREVTSHYYARLAKL